jgi:hypothetical protein
MMNLNYNHELNLITIKIVNNKFWYLLHQMQVKIFYIMLSASPFNVNKVIIEYVIGKLQKNHIVE